MPLTPERRLHHSTRHRQQGLSLVEMMVGVAIGLFIVAGAAVLTGAQLGENRRLLLETQVQQDLRAAADILTRELRRAGNERENDLRNLVWSPAFPATQPSRNTRLGLALDQNSDKVSYRYSRPSVDPNTLMGYRLTGGVIQQRNGNNVQALTDANTLVVDDFDVDVQAVPAIQVACPRLCADGTQDCWPTLTVTDATVTITGHATTEPSLVRTIVSRVRLRNDGLQFNVPGSTQVCP